MRPSRNGSIRCVEQARSRVRVLVLAPHEPESTTSTSSRARPGRPAATLRRSAQHLGRERLSAARRRRRDWFRNSMRVEMRRAIARSCVEISIDRPSAASSSARIDDDHLLRGRVDAVQRLVEQQQRAAARAAPAPAGHAVAVRRRARRSGVGTVGEADARELSEPPRDAARGRAADTTAGAGSRRSARRRAP